MKSVIYLPHAYVPMLADKLRCICKVRRAVRTLSSSVSWAPACKWAGSPTAAQQVWSGPTGSEGTHSTGVVWEHHEISDGFLTTAQPAVHPQPPLNRLLHMKEEPWSRFPGLQGLATVKLIYRFWLERNNIWWSLIKDWLWHLLGDHLWEKSLHVSRPKMISFVRLKR